MHPFVTTTRSRCSAWLLVVVYLLSMPAPVPTAVAALAALSNEHEVRIALSDGHMDVALHHDDAHHAHVHHGVARAITGISAHDAEDDHVLHFATGSDAFSSGDAALKVPAASAVSVKFESITFHPDSHAPEAIRHHPARPPPDASALMRCLRTTVLVV